MDQFPPLQTKVSPSRQFFILLGLVSLGFLLASFVSIIAILVIPGASPEAVVSADPSMAGLMQWLQVASTLCIFLIPVLLFKLIVHPSGDYLKFKKRSSFIIWLIVIGLALSAIPTADLLTSLTEHIPISAALKTRFEQMEEQYNSQMLLMLQLDSFSGYLKSLILIALLPAVFEELLFRGCLQQIMLKWTQKTLPAILITSIIFSAIHGSYFGFLPRVFIGLLLGYVFFYGRNIWLNMLIHFINNGMIITVLYYQNLRTGSIKEALKSQTSTPLGFIGLVALILLFVYFIKLCRRQSISKNDQNQPVNPNPLSNS